MTERTLNEMCRDMRLRADVAFGAEPNANFRDSQGWTVTLRRSKPRLRLTVCFYTGLALREPTAEDVLDCLLSDASTVDGCRGFEDWCTDLDHNADSIKALRLFESCRTQSGKLRKFLGDDYEAFICAERNW